MRISDWSSDVCSSDLVDHAERAGRGGVQPIAQVGMLRCLRRRAGGAAEVGTCCGIVEVVEGRRHHEGRVRTQEGKVRAPGLALRLLAEPVEEGTGEEGSFGLVLAVARRSEEHTSELQSLMRRS